MVNYWLIGIIALIAFLLLLTLYLRARLKKKQRSMLNPLNVPEDVMNDFKELERRLKESNGEKDGYTIIWEYARERANRNGNGKVRDNLKGESSPDADSSGEPAVESNAGVRELESGQDIQSDTASINELDNELPEQSEPDNNNSTQSSDIRERLRQIFNKVEGKDGNTIT